MLNICYLQDAEDKHAHLSALVDFALEMKARLEEVNKHSFNDFKLRVGEFKYLSFEWVNSNLEFEYARCIFKFRVIKVKYSKLN